MIVLVCYVRNMVNLGFDICSSEMRNDATYLDFYEVKKLDMDGSIELGFSYLKIGSNA